MDPKQPTNQLDPKLQEAYNRVMGTPTAPTQAAPAPVPTMPQQPMAKPPMPPATTTPMPTPPTPPVANKPLMHVEEVSTTPIMHPTMPITPQPPMMPHADPMPTAPVMPKPPVAPTMQASPIPMHTPTAPVMPQMPTPQPAMPVGGHTVPPHMPIGPAIQPESAQLHAAVPLATPAGAHVSPQTHGFVAKKKAGISPVILIVGAIAFLLAYTVFWIKFFNIPLPFINQ